MEENNYTEALRALHEALVELKAMGKNCEDKIQKIEIILEKQGLKDWEAGATVNKDYCEKSHETLTCAVMEENKELKKSVNGKINNSWVVITFILGLYAAVLLVLLKEVF